MVIEEVIKAGEDEEIVKYKILSHLKGHISLFRINKLYPSLTELINSVVKLENMINVTLEVNEPEKSALPFDEELAISEYHIVDNDFSALVKWAIGEINTAIDEAIPIFEFVEQNLDIVRISGLFMKNDEGYFIVSDKVSKAVNIYYFNTIHLDGGKSPIRSMKIRFLHKMLEEELIYKSSQPSIKTIMDFIGSNEATVFLCKSDLEFPYEETILPLAKKKLLKVISLPP